MGANNKTKSKIGTKKDEKNSEKSKNAIQNMFAKIVKKTSVSDTKKEPEIIEIDIDQENEEEKITDTPEKNNSPVKKLKTPTNPKTPSQKTTPKKAKTPN